MKTKLILSALLLIAPVVSAQSRMVDCGLTFYYPDRLLTDLETEMCSDMYLAEEVQNEYLADAIVLGEEIDWLYSQLGGTEEDISEFKRTGSSVYMKRALKKLRGMKLRTSAAKKRRK